MALVAVVFAANGQQISVGIVGGTNITANFPITDYSGAADDFGNPAYRFQYMTGPRSFILGASVEGHLSDRFSIEANVLHRPMKSTINFTAFHADGSTIAISDTATAFRAWEFPVMLKYTLPASRFSGRARPFLAVGPSFRTQEDATATEPSQFGISAGVGAAIRLGRFRLAPSVRYTRWGREDISPRYATKPDQVEFLTSFSYETHTESRRVGNRRLEIGAVAGLAPTNGFDSNFGEFTERPRYLAGLTAQAALKGNWAVEVNAIYKPLRARDYLDSSFVVLTWQFPVLAKYRWTKPGWAPFVAAGPSFRLAGNLNGYNPSHLGATFGAGVELQADGIRLSPAIRYTRWRRDTPESFPSSLLTKADAVELVFGVSF